MKWVNAGAPRRLFEGHPQLRQRVNDAHWTHQLTSTVSLAVTHRFQLFGLFGGPGEIDDQVSDTQAG